jgi:Sec-independent protein translocase protein TatA
VFEGLLSPTHLLVIAVALFVVIGPRRVATRWRGMRDAGRRLTDEESDGPEATEPAPSQAPTRPLSYRIGRLFRGRTD